MKLSYYVICLTSFVNSFALFATQPATFSENVNPGDLLFQDLDCGELCDAIEDVTQGIENYRLSHVGIVAKNEKSELIVYEAYGPTVRATPFIDFLIRASGDGKVESSRTLLGKLKKSPSEKDLQNILNSAKSTLGTVYDDEFIWSNNKLYCSEVIARSYVVNGKKIFEPKPMTFKRPGEKDFHPTWKKYYTQLKKKIPEGQPGLNPARMTLNPALEISAPWGIPSHNHEKK